MKKASTYDAIQKLQGLACWSGKLHKLSGAPPNDLVIAIEDCCFVSTKNILANALYCGREKMINLFPYLFVKPVLTLFLVLVHGNHTGHLYNIFILEETYRDKS